MSTTPEPRAERAIGSMSLLVDMATAALDPEYQDAAARRSLRGPGPVGTDGRPSLGSGRARLGRVPVVLTCLLLLAGLVTGVAAGQIRQKQKLAGAVRQSLVADVRRQTLGTDALARTEASLRRDVARIRSQALGQDSRGQVLAAELAALELATGAIGVQGPGLVVTLNDAPTSDPAAGSAATGEGRIYDRDLQDVTNALWTAGAEQMTINGQRLTAQTTIRSAGEAVLVDFRPLTPPYVVQAVGDVDVMEPQFVDGPVARRFQTWTSLYGITFHVTRAKLLRLPAAGPADLRHVRLGPT